MTSEEHVQKAEELLLSIAQKVREGKANLDVSSVILAEAQVHATLALALAAQEPWSE